MKSAVDNSALNMWIDCTNASKKFGSQEASSLAAIILPDDISDIIVNLEAALVDANYDTRL
jgi:hypothetical protein